MDGLQFYIYKQVTDAQQQTSWQWVWVNAYTEFGIMMGDGFLDALKAPIPLKPFVTNKSRLMDGERTVISNIRKDSRFLTLVFSIEGSTPADFQTKKDAFYSYLYTGKVDMRFDPTANFQATYHSIKPTSEVFHFIYNGESVSYGEDLTHRSCSLSVKFKEPNPAVRV